MNPIGESRPSNREFICIISKEPANIKHKNRFTLSAIEDEFSNDRIPSSCIFGKREILDFNLVPTFPNYLYAFTSLMVPINTSLKRPMVCPQGLEPKIDLVKHYGVTAIHTTICVLSIVMGLIVHAIEMQQMFVLIYNNTKELYSYILLPTVFLPVVISGHLLNIILRKRKTVSRVFWHPKSITYSDDGINIIYDHNMRKAFKVAKAYVYGFMVTGLLYTVAGVGILDLTDWTLSDLLQENANYIRETFSVTQLDESKNNSSLFNSSIHAQDETFGIETALLGVTGCAFQFFSFVMLRYVEGFFLFAGLTMKEIADKLRLLTDTSTSYNCQRILHTYEFMFQSTTRINSSLGGLFSTFHILTFFSFVLLLRNTLVDTETITDVYWTVWALPEIVVTAAAYYYALKTPVQMNAFRSWIRKEENQDSLRMNSAKLQSLLDEMNTDPNGIGKGVFYVDAGLIAKLLSSIGTFFLVIAPQSRSKN